MDVPRRLIVLPRGFWIAASVVGVGLVLYWLRGVLTPIFLAFAIAYLLDPLVDRLESWRIPRGLGIAIVMLGTLLVIVLAIVLVVPTLVGDVVSVMRELPQDLQKLVGRLGAWLARYGVVLPTSSGEWANKLRQNADQIAASIAAPAGTALTWVVGGTASAIGAFVGALIVPVLAIYLLYDFDQITSGIRDLIPIRFRTVVTGYAREIDAVLRQFVRGQLLVMLILAVLYGSAYSALGVRLAVPIGITAGMLNFVPYLGSAFALSAGLLMSLIGGGGLGQMIGVVIAYAIVQTLEGFFITPRVVGKTVGLRDVWVLLALFVAGELFGFLGVLLALPAAAVAKIFVLRGLAHYRGSTLYLSEAQIEPSAAGSAAPVTTPGSSELAHESEPDRPADHSNEP